MLEATCGGRRAGGVGQASLPASSGGIPAARCHGRAAPRNREHGAGMPRQLAGKDACPTRLVRTPSRVQETAMRPVGRNRAHLDTAPDSAGHPERRSPIRRVLEGFSIPAGSETGAPRAVSRCARRNPPRSEAGLRSWEVSRDSCRGREWNVGSPACLASAPAATGVPESVTREHWKRRERGRDARAGQGVVTVYRARRRWVRRKRAPRGSLGRQAISQPWAETICWTTARPRPVPF